MSREPPKCKNCQKVLKWLPWKNGKPQRPVDPATGQPCDCWKTKGKSGGDYFTGSGGRIFDKADKYKPCPYCSGYYHVDDEETIHKDHIEVYHKDKKVHKGLHVTGEGCFEDEILYHGAGEHWFNNELSVDGKENVKEFAKTHGIKVIRDDYLL